MKHTATILAAALLAIVAFPLVLGATRGTGAGMPQPTFRYSTSASLQPAALRTTFSSIDIFIDSGTTPLAAYQIDFTAAVPRADEHAKASVKVVGIEGGDHPAFRAAPYYDPRAIQGERVIIGALSTLPQDQLPRGKTRVARIHLMTTGTTAAPACTLTLTTAAGAGADRIDATASWQPGPAGDAPPEDMTENQVERK